MRTLFRSIYNPLFCLFLLIWILIEFFHPFVFILSGTVFVPQYLKTAQAVLVSSPFCYISYLFLINVFHPFLSYFATFLLSIFLSFLAQRFSLFFSCLTLSCRTWFVIFIFVSFLILWSLTFPEKLFVIYKKAAKCNYLVICLYRWKLTFSKSRFSTSVKKLKCEITNHEIW